MVKVRGKGQGYALKIHVSPVGRITDMEAKDQNNAAGDIEISCVGHIGLFQVARNDA